MRLFLVIACALGIYVALLLRKVLAIQRDTPLVIFLAMPYLLQLTLGLLTKSQWSLRIHSIGMLVLCFVGGFFWSIASARMNISTGDAYTRARDSLVFAAEIMGACQWLLVASIAVIAWRMRDKGD